jgi:ABC-2 type transport system ATP-binding protein
MSGVAAGAAVQTSFAIETKGLAKHFGGFPAVDGIDLAVPSGSTYGFLGPNGSGKTTTIRVLLGLVGATAGTWTLLGEPMPQRAMSTLPRVGALVEGPAFYPWLSGHDNLARFDAMGPGGRSSTRAQRIAEALARVGLTAAAKKKYNAYSLGMRQRLGLALALLVPRQLLVLDEPTNGMDPQGTREIRHLVRQLGAQGTTVFLSSHLLSEVEQICSHVGVMNRGKLLMQGTLDDFRANANPKLRVEADDPARAAEVLTRMGVADLDRQGAQVVGTLDGLLPEDCCRALVEAGVGVRMLVKEQVSLEDAFVAMTGEGFDVAG